MRDMKPYRTPFEIERFDAGIRLTNTSPQTLRWIRFIAAGPAVAVARAIPHLASGGSIVIEVWPLPESADAFLVVQWTRPNDDTYLQAIAL